MVVTCPLALQEKNHQKKDWTKKRKRDDPPLLRISASAGCTLPFPVISQFRAASTSHSRSRGATPPSWSPSLRRRIGPIIFFDPHPLSPPLAFSKPRVIIPYHVMPPWPGKNSDCFCTRCKGPQPYPKSTKVTKPPSHL